MVKLVCFDFDGVIVQTESQHNKWTMEDLEKCGVTYTVQDLAKLMGGNMLVREKNLDEAFGSQENYWKHKDYLLSKKNRTYDLKALLTPYIHEFMKELFDHGILITVCTNSSGERTHNALVELDLRQYVKQIYSGQDTGHTKPDPFIYTAAMKDFAILPKDTIVFEDSMAGIKAGKASGARVIAIKDLYGIANQSEADHIIENFQEATQLLF